MDVETKILQWLWILFINFSKQIKISHCRNFSFSLFPVVLFPRNLRISLNSEHPKTTRQKACEQKAASFLSAYFSSPFREMQHEAEIMHWQKLQFRRRTEVAMHLQLRAIPIERNSRKKVKIALWPFCGKMKVCQFCDSGRKFKLM